MGERTQLSLPIQTKKPPPELPHTIVERVVDAAARLIRQVDLEREERREGRRDEA